MSFESLGLSAALLKTLRDQNYEQPYPIQEHAIPHILSGKDLLGIAHTGSGKTASFILPILMKIEKSAPVRNRHIKALILVPTRELAIQVHEVMQSMSSDLSRHIKSMAVYGGVSINPQMIGLQHVEILIATPGRLLDLIDHKALKLAEVSILVMDEADKLLNMGFKDEVNRILNLLPLRRQNLLFSATLNQDIENLHQLVLKNPEVIKIESEEISIDLIQQTAYSVTEDRKGPLLRYLIKKNDLKQVLVFTSSVEKADKVVNKLSKNGIEAKAIHSKLSQGARTDALRKFKSGQLRVLVATDLISRGIDIEFLPCVVNYELPRSPKDFIHRIGRTGRAGSSGQAISFVTEDDQAHFKVINKKTGTWVDLEDSSEINLLGY